MKQHGTKLFSMSVYLLLLVSSLSAAVQPDRDQPITIEADRVDVDDVKGTSVYRGNVIFRQGSMELLAEELTIKTTAKRELELVKAVGTPARFKQENPPGSGELIGHAQEITYDVNADYMLFVKDAYFWQCGDEVTGNQVEYFGQQARVKASKGESEQSRVQVTLQPRQDGRSSNGCSQQGTP